ncbi:MAG TPA: hypothetical protein VD999_05890 [Vitreimonas sp.]|nr:hypothetical protein [Vitreimonas sp.]
MRPEHLSYFIARKTGSLKARTERGGFRAGFRARTRKDGRTASHTETSWPPEALPYVKQSIQKLLEKFHPSPNEYDLGGLDKWRRLLSVKNIRPDFIRVAALNVGEKVITVALENPELLIPYFSMLKQGGGDGFGNGIGRLHSLIEHIQATRDPHLSDREIIQNVLTEKFPELMNWDNFIGTHVVLNDANDAYEVFCLGREVARAIEKGALLYCLQQGLPPTLGVNSFPNKYLIAGVQNKIKEYQPHLINMVNDKLFLTRIVRELFSELKIAYGYQNYAGVLKMSAEEVLADEKNKDHQDLWAAAFWNLCIEQALLTTASPHT